MTTPVMRATGLATEFAGKPVFRDVSVSLDAGEPLFVLGRSGSGKTTFARCLLGLQPLSGGQIAFFGGDGRGLHHRPVGFLSAVFQSLALFPHLTVLGNV